MADEMQVPQSEAPAEETTVVVPAETPVVERLDPGADPVAVAEKRQRELVDTMSDSARVELTAMRDQIDDLLQAIEARNAALTGVIAEHARFVADAIQVKVIAGEALAALRSRFLLLPRAP